MVGLTRQINVSRPSDRLVSIIAIIATIANSATEQHHGCGCSQIIGSDLPPVRSIDRSSSDDPCTSTSSALRSSHDSRGAHDSLKPASKASVDQATTQQARPHVPVDLSSVQASAPSRVAERQPVRPKHCTTPTLHFDFSLQAQALDLDQAVRNETDPHDTNPASQLSAEAHFKSDSWLSCVPVYQFSNQFSFQFGSRMFMFDAATYPDPYDSITTDCTPICIQNEARYQDTFSILQKSGFQQLIDLSSSIDRFNHSVIPSIPSIPTQLFQPS